MDFPVKLINYLQHVELQFFFHRFLISSFHQKLYVIVCFPFLDIVVKKINYKLMGFIKLKEGNKTKKLKIIVLKII
jgi:hypothetical protein